MISGYNLDRLVREKVTDYLKIEQKEVTEGPGFYRDNNLKTFKHFILRPYSNKDVNDKMTWLSRYYGEISEKKEILTEIILNPEMKILDAGCGIGSESILFSMFGASVIGVDIISERLQLAKERKSFFEKKLGCNLNLEFINGNIFEIINQYRFDAIWLREAISHIHPLETFLEIVYHKLGKNGLIYISDSNWANPYIKYAIFQNYHGRFKWYWLFSRLRESSTFYVHPQLNPTSDIPVFMAEERLFSPRAMLRMLEKTGFHTVSWRTTAFLPKATLSKLAPSSKKPTIYNFLCQYERLLQNVPYVRGLGARVIWIGEKL